ncbi:hypothetical protein [Hydrogenivirga sp. 128-5-R1-1]|uniref:hypothetical protein n=1 Tax=Hydrogenivirga sp. 128-5-R1-1 TaxID=392423 RepID=UPI0012FB98F4|nr:hypothetical protein [Hydrogenivirga sp. 128-5-R1-1]
MSNRSLSQLITELEKLPPEELEEARKFVPLMIYQMRDEDLEKLDREGLGEKGNYFLMAMLLFPKERWEELGIPEYLRKYEIADEEDDW